MRIAVIGAGLAGLGASHFLVKQGHSVTIFDEIGVGAGASGIPIGLCHPYLGRNGKPSKFSTEALLLTNELIDIAEKVSGRKLADRNGILRTDWVPSEWYPDLEKVEEGILIRSGMTVFMRDYVKALYQSLEDVELIIEKISIDNALKEFDRVVFACGEGMRDFNLPVSFVKGQVLIGRLSRAIDRTVMKARGHLSPFTGLQAQLGSTYEHHYLSNKPDLEVADRELAPKLNAFFPNLSDFQIVDCFAGVRVCVKEGYLPIVKQLREKVFVFTGLGSRGLLYHAYYGRHLADMII